MQSSEDKQAVMEQAMEKFAELMSSLGSEQVQNFEFKNVSIILKVDNEPDKIKVTCRSIIDGYVNESVLT